MDEAERQRREHYCSALRTWADLFEEREREDDESTEFSDARKVDSRPSALE